MLAFIASEGTYKEREAAIRCFATFRNLEVISVLQKALSDRVKCVAFAAIETLRILGKEGSLKEEIDATVAYWAKREDVRRANWDNLSDHKRADTLIDKSKMVRYEWFKRKVLGAMNKGRFYGM